MSENKQDSFESRVKQAAEILGIPTQEIENGLNDDLIGIENGPLGLNMLSDEKVFRFEDFKKVFGPDSTRAIKISKIRMSYEILRGAKQGGVVEKATEMDSRAAMLKERFGIRGSINMVPTDDLLRVYDPSLSSDPVTNELKTRFKDQRVIVFKPDSREVAVDETLLRARDLNDGMEVPDQEMVGGLLVDCYAVGQTPNLILDEDPLVPGDVLRRDRSVKTRMDWTGIATELRQFARLLVTSREIDPYNRRDIADLTSDLKKGIESLAQVYPEQFAQFRKDKQLGNLPSLKVEGGAGGAVNNPFKTVRGNRST